MGVTEVTIVRKYSESLKKKHGGMFGSLICEGCGKQRAEHNDHTIAKARCKVIHKTELIWNPKNYVSSCSTCHRQWENFKSGEWIHHLNVEERLLFLKQHDPDGYNTRIELTFSILEQQQHDDSARQKDVIDFRDSCETISNEENQQRLSGKPTEDHVHDATEGNGGRIKKIIFDRMDRNKI